MEGYRAGFENGLLAGRKFGQVEVNQKMPEVNAVVNSEVEPVENSMVKLPKMATKPMVEPTESSGIKLPKPVVKPEVKPAINPLKATDGMDPFKILLPETFGRR